MNILHIASLTDDKSKGPNTNVPKNILYGNKVANVGLYNLTGSKLTIELPRDKVFSAKKYKHINELPSPFNRPDIVIFQCLYYIEYCHIANWLRKNNIPYVIVPRCSMTTAAIRSHPLKKKIGNTLLFNKFIANATSIQFLTKNEYLESKNNFRFKDYFVLGNGVELPKKYYTVKNREEFKIVFIGRYNVYHKGLDVLLQAIKDYEDWFIKNHVVLELYGSDSDNGLKYLTSYVQKNYLDDIVKIMGSAFGEVKEKALLDADAFIHTSRLEGQPTAVIEAISYGIPVIVTPGTNVVDIVERYNLGFTPELNSKSIFESIKTAFAKRDELFSISKNELDYAGNNLAWGMIAKQSIEQFLRGGELQ